jgi:hypothetical protein
MWIQFSAQEIDLIESALLACGLDTLKDSISGRVLNDYQSPVNRQHTRKQAVKAAQTYFSSDDTFIENDYVRWDKDGNALVLVWQKVPKDMIEDADCNCLKKD